MKTQDENSAKAKTINETGREFLQELLRHHFGCGRSEPSIILRMALSEAPARVQSINTTGDELIARLVRYFHHDDSFVEETGR